MSDHILDIVQRFIDVPKTKLINSTNGNFSTYQHSQYDSDCYCLGTSIVTGIDRCNRIETGFTKSVYFFEDCPDYVFKIPITTWTFFKYDDELCDYIEFKKESWNGNPVDCDNPIGNYCDRERSIYEDAKSIDLDRFFASIEQITTLPGGIPLYISEFLTPVDEEETLVSVNDFTLRQFGVPNEIEMRFILDWGIDNRDSLYDFLESWGINDLHSSNWGIGKDGKVRILDYGGYYASYDVNEE